MWRWSGRRAAEKMEQIWTRLQPRELRLSQCVMESAESRAAEQAVMQTHLHFREVIRSPSDDGLEWEKRQENGTDAYLVLKGRR